MEIRIQRLRLKGFGAPPADAEAELAVLSAPERLRRAGLTFGAFAALALIAIPIPVVHFVLVPGALLLGAGLAVVRLGQSEVFREVEGSCPFCGTGQQFTVLGRFRLPRTVHCASCQRELELTT